MKVLCSIKKTGTAVAILLFLFSSQTKAQSREKANQINKVSPRADFYLILSGAPVLYNGLNVDAKGEDLLGSKPTLSGLLNISSGILLQNNTGLKGGVSVSIVPDNFNFNFLAKINQPGQEEYHKSLDHYDYFIPQVSFPLSLYQLFPRKNPKSFKGILVELGVRGNLIPDYLITGEVSIIGNKGEQYNIFQARLENPRGGNGNLFYLSYFMKGGILCESKKGKQFEFFFMINYSPTVIGKGTFSFTNISRKSSGTLTMKPNFAGIGFSYHFLH